MLIAPTSRPVSAPTRSHPPRTLGILGGMGPLAGAEFFMRVTAAFPADRDQAHPVVHLLSNPTVDSRSDAVLAPGRARHDEVERDIRRGIAALLDLGADVIAVPCNTAHYFIDRFHNRLFSDPTRAGSSAPVLAHIVDATLSELTASGQSAAWLLATEGTVRSGVYTARAAAHGVDLRIPGRSTQSTVTRCIEAVKRGDIARSVQLAEDLRALSEGTHMPLVAACTELPIAFRSSADPLPHVSSIDALVARTIALLTRP
ncbi:MAG: amino acid racemase [Mobilicoccus sp.]|nr:amino acid racemase [Mobilicoccus sp.]